MGKISQVVSKQDAYASAKQYDYDYHNTERNRKNVHCSSHQIRVKFSLNKELTHSQVGDF